MDFRYDNRYEYGLIEACREYGFLASPSFWDQNDEYLRDIWNGLGADGAWINPLIPEAIFGVNISLASLPHDWMHLKGETRKAFHISNLYFLHNMNQIVRKHSNEFMKMIRYMRTNKYYIAVESPIGYRAFCQGKPILHFENNN